MDFKKFSGLKIGLAVSGGVDSMVMADMMLKSGADVRLIINFEHGLRGLTSERDSAFVAEYAEKHDIECRVVKLDVLKYAGENGLGTEEAARVLRYESFAEILDSGAVDVIATAHHLNDNAETVLMRLFRGTGIRGLKGISEREGFIRPLADMTKEEILRYAAENSVPYRTDETNADTGYTRNYIRNKLIPLISARFPGFERRIQRLSESMRETDDLLDTLKTPAAKEEGGAVSLPLSAFEAHPAVVKKSVSDAMRALGVYQDVEKKHLDAISALKDAETGKRVALQFDTEAIRESDRIVFAPAIKKTDEAEYVFDIDGNYTLYGKKYSFRETDRIERGVCFDPRKIPADAVVRARKAGDRFRRCNGRDKSLGDYLTDRKYPLRLRDSLAVVASGSRVLMILGVEISDEVKTDPNTQTIYKVHIGED